MCGVLFFRAAVLDDAFGILNVDIAEVGVPVLIGRLSCVRKLASSQCLVDIVHGSCELVQDPKFGKRFSPCPGLTCGQRLEIRWQLPKNIFRGLINLVAEFSIAMHDFNIEINIPAYKTRSEEAWERLRTEILPPVV